MPWELYSQELDLILIGGIEVTLMLFNFKLLRTDGYERGGQKLSLSLTLH